MAGHGGSDLPSIASRGQNDMPDPPTGGPEKRLKKCRCFLPFRVFVCVVFFLSLGLIVLWAFRF